MITLNLEASQINAIKGHTTIVLDIIRTEVIPPIFEQPYYFGKYSDQEGLSFPNVIRLVRGFDEIVSFELEGGKYLKNVNIVNWLLVVLDGTCQ